MDPISVTFEHAPYREIKRYLAEHGLGDRRPDGHPYNKSEFFREPLPVEVIAALVKYLEEQRVPGQSRELDFTPWAGAYNRVPAEATAFAHRDARFSSSCTWPSSSLTPRPRRGRPPRTG